MSVLPDLMAGATPNPWQPVRKPWEDIQNGQSGAYAPDAVANQTNKASETSQTKSSGNAFADILNHTTNFNAAMAPQGELASPPQAQSFKPAPSFGDNPIVLQPDNPPPGGGAPPPTTSPTPRPTLTPTIPQGEHPIPGPGHPRPTNPVTPSNDWLHADSAGKPWGPDNRPPRPASSDPESLAKWYSQHNWLDPTLINVTANDYLAYTTSGYRAPPDVLAKTPEGNNFIAWWQQGKPTPAQQPAPGGAPPPATGYPTPPGTPGPNNVQSLFDLQNEAIQRGVPFDLEAWKAGKPQPWQTTTPPSGSPPPAGGTPPGTPPPGTPTPPTPPGAPPGTPTPPPGTPPATPSDEIQKMLDLYNQTLAKNQPPPIEDLLNPMFARQRQNLIGDLDAQAAASGALHSGGYGENRATAVATLGGQQSAALANELSQENLAKMNQNTQLTQLATQAGMQKYLSDVNTDLTKFQVNNYADLQRWLSDKDNALKKYGIDSNDVLQRYLGKLGIDKANIDAAATVNAAALHAAAAEAAAHAQANADMARTAVTRELGLAGLGVDREKNIGNFILALLGMGQQNMFDLNNILSGIPGGSIVVKP